MKDLKFNVRNILLLIVTVAFILWFFKNCFNTGEDEKVVTDLPTMNEVEELKELKTATGKSVYEMQHEPAPKLSQSGISKAKYDSILKELKLKENAVRSLTIFSGKMKDSLKLTKIQLDEQKFKVWKWEKTLASGTKISRVMSEKDSILHESSDIRVAVLDKIEGRGKDARFYTIFFPLDNNIKFNGASVYRKENAEIRDVLQLDVGGELQKSFLSPNARVISDVELSFFPDGRFVPSVKVGGMYDVGSGLDWFWGARVQYNIFRIKNQRK